MRGSGMLALHTRPRRLRTLSRLRDLVRETRLQRDDLVQPLFVCPGTGVRAEIAVLPGQYRLSIDMAVEECRALADLGVPGVILFGIPARKDAVGSEAYAPDGIIARALQALSAARTGLLLIADVCLCEYTDHGHCGVLEAGSVANDPTVELLARAAVVYAQAGAHIVAPSDMMDGRVRAVREALDAAGRTDVAIMSYAAKYASAFYGPFREAAGSAPQFGDRRGYQMDPGNAREALREIRLDIAEGADIVMVKPALAYLDVLREARAAFDVPLAAYNVSGEYAMVRAAAAQGWIDGPRIRDEILLSIKRAGADIIITYFAKEMAAVLR